MRGPEFASGAARLLEKRISMRTQTQMTNRDGSVSLDLLAPAGAQTSLAALYAKLSAESVNRKVSYKAMKADSFFVVAGEQGQRKFYLQYAIKPPGAPDAGVMRGFEFTYPIAEAAELDRVAVAIANSFEPFPPAPEPDKTAAGAPIELGKTPAPSPSPAPSPRPSEPVLTATALIVAPGKAAAALTEAECKTPSIEGKPAKFVRAEASGLGDFGGAAPLLRLGAGSADVIVLSLGSTLLYPSGSRRWQSVATSGNAALVAAAVDVYRSRCVRTAALSVFLRADSQPDELLTPRLTLFRPLETARRARAHAFRHPGLSDSSQCAVIGPMPQIAIVAGSLPPDFTPS